MTRANKVDRNQAEIVRALRDCGASVQPLNAVKCGCPDILVGFRGRNLLMEIKARGGRMTEDELDWHGAWNGQVVIVWSVDEALAMLEAE